VIYDVIIIGAGPAGCASAITAARSGASVLLLERGRFPRQKVCGEFVSAESLTLLQSILAPKHQAVVASAPRISHARIFDARSELHAQISPPAASITRFDLDLALWGSCAHAGVESHDNCAVTKVEGCGPFAVQAGNGAFSGRALVNASGRWSELTSPQTRSRAGQQRTIGLKAHFREVSSPRTVDLYFFAGGYCGIQPVYFPEAGPAVVNACAMVRAEIATEIGQVLQLHPALELRSRNWAPLTEAVATSPLIFHSAEPVQNQMLQVGDAATFVDPFIGDGISLALRSGALASACLARFFRRELSLQDAAADYALEYRKRLAPIFTVSSRIRRLLRLPALVRRPAMSLLQHMPGLTAQLVRITR